jgi:hypothetical protein
LAARQKRSKGRVALTYKADPKHAQKHRGSKAEAEIVTDVDGTPVGKCSKEISPEEAQSLLDSGIRFPPCDPSEVPKDVYNIHRGVPYRAHRNGANTRNFHGFPDVVRRIPPKVRAELRERAKREGVADLFDRWMKETERVP